MSDQNPDTDKFENLKSLLASCRMSIKSYHPDKPRPYNLESGRKVTAIHIHKTLASNLESVADYPELIKVLAKLSTFEDYLTEYAQSSFFEEVKTSLLPDEYKNLTLNLNVSETLPNAFFLTRPDDTIASDVKGANYPRMAGMSEAEATSVARKVIIKYDPHMATGIIPDEIVDGFRLFNTYTPAPWNKVEPKPLPKGLPPLFEKLVKHLFPLPIECEFFFSWLHASMFNRAMTYLVLCGAPGVGKNRLKLVMRALHGASNTVDGKRSTLTERFNSQLTECTLLWFDELSYDGQMENTLKEIQNDTISIERKGLDATRATRIFASSVISNNKPRDNHIAMDARKFVPLRLTKHRLEKSMAPEEIDLLSRKVADESSPDYDPAFVAQIAKWVKTYGKSDKWPNLEYRGPMFYYLAHTSMSRWQKETVTQLLALKKRGVSGVVYDPEKGYLWSPLHKRVSRTAQMGPKTPDYSTVAHFLSSFVDATGKKIFRVTKVPGDILGDFYVKQLKINVEVNLDVEATKVKNNGKEEIIDL